MSHGALYDLAAGGAKRPLIAEDRWRVSALMALTIASVSAQGYVFAGGAAALAMAALFAAGVPWPYALKRSLFIAPFALGAVVLLPFAIPGDPFWAWGGVSLSSEGLYRAGLTGLKLLAANLWVTLLLATTPVPALLRTLRAVGVPGLLVDIVALTLRYLAVLAGEAMTMLTAQRSRGLRLSGVLPWRTYRRIGELAGALLNRSLARSERVYHAMLARGWQTAAMAGGGRPGEQVEIGLEGGQPRTSRHIAPRPSVQVRGLSYTYPDGIRALHDVNLSIPAGTRVAVMGPNGAGKSTLLLHFNALILPQAGEVRILGDLVEKRTAAAIRRRVGLVFQDADDQVFSSTVWEDVIFGPLNAGLPVQETVERAELALRAVDMYDQRDRPPYALSYGQKKRVAIAGVLAMQPEIVVLDEPMAYLDPQGQDDITSLLEGLHLMGKTVIVSTHDVDFAAAWADMVILMKDGEVLAAGGTELLVDPDVVTRARLRLPVVARLFQGVPGLNLQRLPRHPVEAARILWQLLHMRQTG